MNRQMLQEMWVRNRKNPVLFGLKIVFILFAAIIGPVIGYPYFYLCGYFTFLMQMQNMMLAPQAEYFLPCTDHIRKKIRIRKAFVIAVFYSGLNVVGYMIAYAWHDDYQWNGRNMILVTGMTLLLFLLYMDFEIQFINAAYLNLSLNFDRMNWKKSAFLVSLFAIVMDFLCIWSAGQLTLEGSFTQRSFFSRIGIHTDIVIMIITALLSIWDIKYHYKRIVIGDYHQLNEE